MVIAFDASDPGGIITNGASPLSFSHTCTGSDGLLIVIALGDVNADSVTGVTYNGDAMTLVGKVLASVADRYVYMFMLLGPDTGANDVEVSHTGTLVGACSASYTGIKQTAQPDDSDTNSAVGAASLTGNLTTVADNCWVVMAGLATSLGAGTGATLRQAWSFSANMSIFDSNGAITPAGATSMQETCDPSANPALVIASFAPVTAAGSAGQLVGGKLAPRGLLFGGLVR